LPGTRDGWTRATALPAGFAIASDQQPGGILRSGPVPPISAQNAQIWAASILTGTQPVPAQNGGYLRCAQVMVNYTASGEASPNAAPRCACASIAYGVRWHVGYENPTAPNPGQHATSSMSGRRDLSQKVRGR